MGKYTQLPDAYLSVIEALHHAGVFYDRHVDVQLVDGESLDEQNVSEVLGDASGILVPGGFGKRALEARSSRPSLPVSTRFRIWHLPGYAGRRVRVRPQRRRPCRRQLL